jgi:hypothetical protein
MWAASLLESFPSFGSSNGVEYFGWAVCLKKKQRICRGVNCHIHLRRPRPPEPGTENDERKE